MCHSPCLLILNYCIVLLCIIKQLPHFIPVDLAFKWWIYKGSAALLSFPVQLVEGLPQEKKKKFSFKRRLEKSLGFIKSSQNLFPLSFFSPKSFWVFELEIKLNRGIYKRQRYKSMLLIIKKNFFPIKHWKSFQRYFSHLLSGYYSEIKKIKKGKKGRKKELISNNWEWKQWLSCKYHSRNLSIVPSKFLLCIIFWNSKISERKTAFNSVP